ncbi:MAG TPA: dihydrolipoamide acetyltransferase family protein [Acidimicrobiia bacterium]|nr:dihydrolipoamide acetyltransferase family protein [Acidimicrobiia bacterium]
MAREFRLPDIGEGLTEAEIVRWLVAEGEQVQADQPIVEVETDKAVVEIPSPYAGVIVSHGGAEGDVIEVGEVLVTIGEPGEATVSSSRSEATLGEVSPTGDGGGSPPSPADGGTPPAGGRDREVSPKATKGVEAQQSPFEPEPIVGTLGDDVETLPSARSGPSVPNAVKALPVVRKLARDNDVELDEIDGSGPGGRILREDVEAVIAARTEAAPAAEKPHHAVDYEPVGAGHGVADFDDEDTEVEPASAAAGTPESSPIDAEGTGDERRPMSRLRRTISANMAKSWAEIPHVTTFDDVDATRLLEVRRALGERHAVKIPMEALVVKAILPALDEFPEFNATLDGDDLILHGSKDIGIAVDTPDGLLVAVVRDATEKSVMELAAEVRDLGEGARERKLAPDQLAGQTFTVSNIGAVGGGHGTPIVPYGTVAILSVGAARLRPVVYDEDIAVAPVMPLSLSYDHRVVDGAVGRRFMALVLENLEEPALFLAG